jgi:membrane-associated phospholipid phosphatase
VLGERSGGPSSPEPEPAKTRAYDHGDGPRICTGSDARAKLSRRSHRLTKRLCVHRAAARGSVRVGIAIGVLASPCVARAEGDCPLVPFSRLGRSAEQFAAPVPLILTAAAFVIPAALVPTGLDHRLRVVAQRDLGGRHALEPVSVVAPYAIAGAVLVGYGVSVALGACEWQRPEAAMLEAMAITFGTVAVLKWAAGRQWPAAGRDPDAPDRLEHPEWARDFQPFARGFGAWPSGHSAVAFSAAAALRASSPDLGWLRWLGYPFAAAIGVGMWLGDHHFVSDIASGALLGEAIGSSSGGAFAEDRNDEGVLLVVPEPVGGFVATYARVW